MSHALQPKGSRSLDSKTSHVRTKGYAPFLFSTHRQYAAPEDPILLHQGKANLLRSRHTLEQGWTAHSTAPHGVTRLIRIGPRASTPFWEGLEDKSKVGLQGRLTPQGSHSRNLLEYRPPHLLEHSRIDEKITEDVVTKQRPR
jgi:hypothetical protein